MTSRARKGLAVGLAGMAAALACVPLWACSVPVFRYALERWQADPYELTLFHRGELLAEQKALLERLQSAGPGLVANVRWQLVDLDGNPDGRMLELWKSQRSPELPWLVVQSPATQMEVWAGKLNRTTARGLLDSPARQEIARRLLAGQTAVWVLLDGTGSVAEGGKRGGEGDQSRHEADLALLKERLAEEQAKLKLPEIEAVDIQNGLVEIDPAELKIAFSVLSLSRQDAREKALVAMLLATEDDLSDFQQPMVFPIFGRGRALYALVGDGINAENIHQACAELTGPCTCQVKAQNLGADLLMSVDWAGLVRPTAVAEKPLPPLAGLAALGEPLEMVASEDGSAESKSDTVKGPEEVAMVETSAAAHQASISEPSAADEPQGREGPAGGALPPALDGAQQILTEEGNPLLTGLWVLLGLAVFGIAGASLLIIRR